MDTQPPQPREVERPREPRSSGERRRSAPIPNPKSELPKKFGYFFSEYALAQLALKMDAPPERQQEVLRQYAKGVVEAVFEEVSCPEATGVFLNLDFPTDISVFKSQLRDLLGSVEDMGELASLGREDFELCQDLIARIRNEVIRLVERELDEKGLERKVGVKGQKFGEGGIGKVFACRLGEGNVAAKLIRKEVGEDFTYHRYPELIEATRGSENLVRFFGSMEFTGEESSRLDFFEELRGWMPLSDYWAAREKSERVRRDKLRGYLEKIYLPALLGLKALHDRHLIHGDIKTANILVSGKKTVSGVKLGDYDLVRRSGYQSESGKISGSPAYMSPEHFREKPLTEKTDIFAMGMMLYYAFGGEMVDDLFEIGHRAMEGVDPSHLDCPEPLRQLVEGCVKVDPRERLSVDELIQGIKELLEDPDFGAEKKHPVPHRRNIQAEQREAA